MRIDEKRVVFGILALAIGLVVATPAMAADEEVLVAERDGTPVLVHVAEEPVDDISTVGLLPVLFDTDNPLVARVFSFGGLDRSIEDAAERLTHRRPVALAKLATRGNAPSSIALLAP